MFHGPGCLRDSNPHSKRTRYLLFAQAADLPCSTKLCLSVNAALTFSLYHVPVGTASPSVVKQPLPAGALPYGRDRLHPVAVTYWAGKA